MGAAASQATERIGRYEVVGKLAMGGMAEILLGRLLGPSGFERPVVIKRILPHLAQQPEFVSMFLDEARLAARIQHRNVVAVQELGQEGDNLFLVMEYLEGENAAGLIRRSLVADKELDVALCAFVIAEAAAGLHAAHELTDSSGNPLHLVHRDISPQNIFVTYSGGVRVLDFGIAKAADRTSHTEVGQLKGKFEYMSPEQCRGKSIDRRSDLFALGIVLYEMITRKRLYKRANKLAVLEAVCREPVIPPSKVVPACPPAIERVVLKALAKRVDERYSTALELRRELLAAMREMNAPVEPEEALASLMGELFQDRVSAKRDMLRRVRAGVAVDAVPSAEADAAVEIPEMDLERSGSSGMRARMPSGFSEPPPSSYGGSGVDPYEMELGRARKRLVIRIAGAGAAVLLLGILLVLWVRPESDGVALRAVTAGLRPPHSAMPRPKTPEPPPASAKVVVRCASTPSGASVLVGAESRGKTPLKLELLRSSEAIELTFRADGYEDKIERVTPDMNQRINVSLAKKRPTSGPGGKPPPGGFHRFD